MHVSKPTANTQFRCAIAKVRYCKGPPSQRVGGCQFSFIKLQKLENPFALCTLPGVRSPVPLALPLKSGGARAPTEYMALVPLRHSVKYIFFKFRSDSATGENCSHQSYFPVYRELTTQVYGLRWAVRHLVAWIRSGLLSLVRCNIRSDGPYSRDGSRNLCQGAGPLPSLPFSYLPSHPSDSITSLPIRSRAQLNQLGGLGNSISSSAGSGKEPLPKTLFGAL